MAHIGALKALEEAGRPPVALSGTSFGAIIAAMAALGAPGLEIERIVRRQNVMELWAQALDFGLHRAALIHGQRLERWLDRKIFFGARIEDAERPLAIAATDLRSGAPVVLREGPVARAVRASCALPGIFGSVEIGGAELVDGGFVEPVPFAALAELGPTRMVGVHTGLELAGSTALGRLRALDRSAVGRWLHRVAAGMRGATPWGRLVIGLSLSLRSYRHDARAPAGAELITVAPPIAWWDFHRSPVAIEAGERAVRAWLADRPSRVQRPERRASVAPPEAER
jgi:NTE family protein